MCRHMDKAEDMPCTQCPSQASLKTQVCSTPALFSGITKTKGIPNPILFHSLIEAGGSAQYTHGIPLDCLALMDRKVCAPGHNKTVIIGKTEFWAGYHTQDTPQTAA